LNTQQPKKIGILIVAYNAVSTLVGVLNRIPAHVWEDIEQVVVFDDASQDNTYELALEYKQIRNEPKLTVMRNPVNLGYGGNQKTGYQYLIEQGIDVAVLLHGDGQYAPEILDHLYMPIVRGETDAVFGSRMMQDYGGALKGGMPLYKYVGNRILTFFENRALGVKLTEFHSGYRAYDLGMLSQIDFSRMTNDFHFDTEIIIKLYHQGYKIKEVPIPTYYGDEICYVNGMKYAGDVVKAVLHYRSTINGTQIYPEFAEYREHYPLKDAEHSSHYYFQNMLGTEEDVLDVGAGEGYFAAAVLHKQNRMVGVDMLTAPKHEAIFADYLSLDLNQGLQPVIDRCGEQHFDKILLQDVLEHLYQPEKVLADCHRLLKPGGTILISLPNVANITVRLGLLFGQFNYSERGILDRTHLRFFTRKTARQFIETAGYRIVRQEITSMPFELALGLSSKSRVTRFFNRLLAFFTHLMPGLLGYQLIFVAEAEPVAEIEAYSMKLPERAKQSVER
jgi:glycosyltransferase involved in cell wall biosynthesis/ubiquinone/menaquinone biosynthesis C-methylase UbiE